MKQYKYKDSVKLYTYKNDLHVVFLNEHKELVIEIDEPTFYLLELIGNCSSLSDIVKQLQDKYPDVKMSEIEEQIHELIDLNIVEEIQTHQEYNYDVELLNRQVNLFGDYSLPNINQHMAQETLTNSHVLIVGVGGIGSWIAYNLAQSGVGNLTIIDPDKITLSNLSRQALYFREDIGKYKVDVLSERLKSINNTMKINKVKEYVMAPSDLDCSEKPINLVINCSDQPNAYTTGMIVTEFCIPRNIPHINGIGYRGNICRLGTTTIPHESMCWNCIYQDKEWDMGKYTELIFDKHTPTAGSTSSISSLIASIHAWEAIKILCPLFTPTLINKTGEINLNDLTIEWFDEVQSSDCEICGRKANNKYEVLK